MSKLKEIRELQNLTQEELAESSGISVRTIQRIEAGTIPKGYTLRTLSKTLGIPENVLQNIQSIEIEEEQPTAQEKTKQTEEATINYSLLKIINLSSIPFVVLPPLNILIPLFLMFKLKQKNLLVKQIISMQIIWTIFAPIIFMLWIFLKLRGNYTLAIMVLIVLSNLFIIIRNAIEIDRKQKLYCKLNFNMI
ncbi:helix-turn-helix domain-containing protein [Chryseobacterium sp. RG1]|uniref:Helix-turn-helix domain-containing protein n=1 Tax=Chryseobacterium tagetis TaxID=2801334 RepID=A0ABS8A0F8_9FLAO|nr:helix-turn-helix domain-containing protein [Chryseobacterium tagetis]MCA6066917.1 helix-turn-helix domain-containing protein [Chryseobacterium tagetis]